MRLILTAPLKKISQNGAEQFINLGRCTMKLRTLIRQSNDQIELRNMQKTVI
jgi:hypothetical protein